MLHMIKLAVGCPTLEVLAERMRRERVGGMRSFTHAQCHAGPTKSSPEGRSTA